MKDFKLIEILMDIVYYPFKFELIKLEKINELDEDLMMVFKLVYRLLL